MTDAPETTGTPESDGKPDDAKAADGAAADKREPPGVELLLEAIAEEATRPFRGKRDSAGAGGNGLNIHCEWNGDIAIFRFPSGRKFVVSPPNSNQPRLRRDT